MTQKVVARICDCGKRLDYDRIGKRWYCSDCEPDVGADRSELHNYEEYLLKNPHSMTKKRLLLSQMKNYNEAKKTFSGLFTSHSQAEDAARLIRHLAGEQRIYHILIALIDCLREKKIYVYLRADEIISFLNDYGWINYEKVKLLDGFMNLLDLRCRKNEIPKVLQAYLNENDDIPEERYAILQVLLKDLSPMNEEILERYILFQTGDENYKGKILRLIFRPDFVGEYLRDDLLREYLARGLDDPDVTMEVTQMLAAKGFCVDERQMDQLILGPLKGDNLLLQILLENGSPSSNKAVDHYILHRGTDFSGPVMDQLMRRKYMVSPQAFITYLLDITDRDDRMKAVHFQRMLGIIPATALQSQKLRIGFRGRQIRCNLLQGYVINGRDSFPTVQENVRAMMSVGVNLNDNITVDNRTLAFRRFARDYRGELSETANRICDENPGKKFSLF